MNDGDGRRETAGITTRLFRAGEHRPVAVLEAQLGRPQRIVIGALGSPQQR